MQYSIIQKSQLEGAYRIDAEYYQPEYLEIVEKLKKINCKTLAEISESLESFGAYALTNQIEWADEGVPFVVAADIKDGFLNLDNARFITDKTNDLLSKSAVKEGQVLLSMSGSVGEAAAAYKVPNKLNSNQDIVKITPKKELSAFYLSTFLNSRYGKKQVLRLPVGSVQQHIFLWQTKTLLVPVLSRSIQEEIEEICKKALDREEHSTYLMRQAENLLLVELGLKDFEIENKLSNIVNFSDIQNTNRIDAEYFQKKYERLINKINNFKPIKLKDVAERRIEKINNINKQQKYNYIEISDINVSDGTINFNILEGNELPANAKFLIEGEELLVSKVRPTRGAIGIIPNEYKNNFIVSGAFSIFKINSLQREYLQVILRSIIGKLQMERPTTGTSYPTITDQDVENLIIPILPKAKQEKIADLVRKSHEARKKARELLEEAKIKVESTIEKGGE